MNNRPADPRTARNKNVLIIGGSGSGKTRFWLKPNLMQCTSKKYPVSFVVRRLWLHHVQGENVRNIAQQEGVAHSCVVASITSAERKIFKIVSKSTTKIE